MLINALLSPKEEAANDGKSADVKGLVLFAKLVANSFLVLQRYTSAQEARHFGHLVVRVCVCVCVYSFVYYFSHINQFDS